MQPINYSWGAPRGCAGEPESEVPQASGLGSPGSAAGATPEGGAGGSCGLGILGVTG